MNLSAPAPYSFRAPRLIADLFDQSINAGLYCNDLKTATGAKAELIAPIPLYSSPNWSAATSPPAPEIAERLASIEADCPGNFCKVDVTKFLTFSAVAETESLLLNKAF